MESHQYQRHKEVKQMLRDDIENIIGYRFKDVSLLTTALTHSSYANDFLGDPAKGNERLEFLGDAILDAVVGYELFRRFPDYNEGSLTKLRAEIVCESALSAAAVSATELYSIFVMRRLSSGYCPSSCIGVYCAIRLSRN